MPLIHSGENPIFADAVPNCGMTRCRDLLRLLSREPLFIGRGEEDSRLGQILVSLYTDAPMSATIIGSPHLSPVRAPYESSLTSKRLALRQKWKDVHA
jgi:hypothetical protein